MALRMGLSKYISYNSNRPIGLIKLNDRGPVEYRQLDPFKQNLVQVYKQYYVWLAKPSNIQQQGLLYCYE
jgi:hypothetical protein